MKHYKPIDEFNSDVVLTLRGSRLFINDKETYTNINHDVKKLLCCNDVPEMIIAHIKENITRIGISAACALHGFTHIENLVYESC